LVETGNPHSAASANTITLRLLKTESTFSGDLLEFKERNEDQSSKVAMAFVVLKTLIGIGPGLY